jgi:glycine betaine/choline ABC-type transport system substrate-binding protein
MARLVGRAAVGLGCGLGLWGTACFAPDTVTVASKNFTESVILGEIVAQQLERAGLRVDRRLNLGGTFICHEAMKSGQIDVYVEYTGTAHAAILELPTERDRDRVRLDVDSVYQQRWSLEWLPPLGFNNTFAMLIRGSDARRLGIRTLSEARPHAPAWRPGFGYEFTEREDGYRGLLDTYGLQFASRPSVMDLGLTYRALAEGKVDIIAGNSTDAQIQALDLVHLVDDRHYFPPYEAAPVIRTDGPASSPVARRALEGLAGAIDETTMRELNYLVDVDKRNVREVVEEFLDRLAAVGSPDSVAAI